MSVISEKPLKSLVLHCSFTQNTVRISVLALLGTSGLFSLFQILIPKHRLDQYQLSFLRLEFYPTDKMHIPFTLVTPSASFSTNRFSLRFSASTFTSPPWSDLVFSPHPACHIRWSLVSLFSHPWTQLWLQLSLSWVFSSLLRLILWHASISLDHVLSRFNVTKLSIEGISLKFKICSWSLSG